MNKNKNRPLNIISHIGCLMLTCLLSIPLNAADFITQAKIDAVEAYINQSKEQLEIPGLAIGIIDSNSTVFLKGYGIRNLAGEPMTADTSVELGSASKSLTALAVMQLASEQLLDIDRPVVSYLPSFRSNNKELSDKILVRHLLNHRSGFSTIDGNQNTLSQDVSNQALRNAIENLAELELSHDPGVQFQYSNINYQILAGLLESIENKLFESVIDAQVFNALSMQNSCAIYPQNTKLDVAQGFYFEFGSLTPVNLSQGRLTLAQGRLKSSASDMLIYLQHLISADSETISQSTKEQIFLIPGDDFTRGYGMGWQISQQKDHWLMYHFGRSFGFESLVLFSPELNFGMVALVNVHSSFGSKNIGNFLSGIGDILLGETPAPIAPAFTEKLLLWILYFIPLLIIAAAARFTSRYRHHQRLGLKQSVSALEIVRHLVIPSAILLGVSYIVLFFLPAQHAVTLEVIAVSEPTLYFGMMLCALFCLTWFVMRSVFIVKSIRASFRHQPATSTITGH